MLHHMPNRKLLTKYACRQSSHFPNSRLLLPRRLHALPSASFLKRQLRLHCSTQSTEVIFPNGRTAERALQFCGQMFWKLFPIVNCPSGVLFASAATSRELLNFHRTMDPVVLPSLVPANTRCILQCSRRVFIRSPSQIIDPF